MSLLLSTVTENVAPEPDPFVVDVTEAYEPAVYPVEVPLAVTLTSLVPWSVEGSTALVADPAV
jgi:hypothetical protein